MGFIDDDETDDIFDPIERVILGDVPRPDDNEYTRKTMLYLLGQSDDEDELIEALQEAGLDPDELEDMDEDEIIEALEDAGLDPDDYDDLFD